jgi:hypothetical protein
MPRIDYKQSGQVTVVYLEGRAVGQIKPMPKTNLEQGFAYFPNGSKTQGDVFPTIERVKRSIETGR